MLSKDNIRRMIGQNQKRQRQIFQNSGDSQNQLTIPQKYQIGDDYRLNSILSNTFTHNTHINY
jgi:hypothetical protein